MSQNSIKDYKEEIVREEINNPAELDEYRLKWLSKKGIIQSLYGRIKEIPNEQKREWGAQVNELKNLAEEKFAAANAYIESLKNASTYSKIDVTLDAAPISLGAHHPLSIIRDRMIDIFSRLGFVIAEGPEIVDEWHNFTALNMPEDHPARDMQDTFFIRQNPTLVLRTHTSSVQVKTMQSQEPPIRIISPGRVFRKDSDATHSPVFHQIEGLYVAENVSFADLKQTLYYFVQEMFGEHTKIRFRPSYFPFTEPSAEMDISSKKTNPETGAEEDSWLEVLGCGMVDPAVLENCGIDSSKYTGFAFGMGVERIAMVKYNIKDIRLFYENDIRFLSQFVGAV